jgi:hypothetical protein
VSRLQVLPPPREEPPRDVRDTDEYPVRPLRVMGPESESSRLILQLLGTGGIGYLIKLWVENGYIKRLEKMEARLAVLEERHADANTKLEKGNTRFEYMQKQLDRLDTDARASAPTVITRAP